MSWDEARFERFFNDTAQMARGRLTGYGHPHVILPYPPQLELECTEEVRKLPKRLEKLGLEAEVVSVAPYAAQVWERFARRTLHDLKEYERLQATLSTGPLGLVPSLAARLAADVRMKAEGQVLILCRLGVLYPFGHVSALLGALVEHGFRSTVAVVYPGTAEGTELRLLGHADPTGGYRGDVVT